MAVYYYNTNLCDIPSHFFETQIYDHSHSEGDLWSRVRRRLTNRYYNKPSYSYKCKYHNRENSSWKEESKVYEGFNLLPSWSLNAYRSLHNKLSMSQATRTRLVQNAAFASRGS